MFLCVTVCAGPAYGETTCHAGYYLNGDTCTACPVGTYKDTTGPQECTPCPPTDETTVRTTIPDEYYPYDPATGTYVKTTEPTLVTFRHTDWLKGTTRQSGCGGYYEYNNSAGKFRVESVYYNVTTGKYDSSAGITGYLCANPGYYLDTRFRENYCDSPAPYMIMMYRQAIICPAGYYCPGGYIPFCTAGPYENEWGRTICPAGHYCPAGASAPTPCPIGTYSDTTGASACNPCTNAPQNASYIGNATTNSCPWECDDGYGLHNDACASLCAADMRYLKTGNGLRFNLYQVAYSSPALHVKRNHTICYGILAPGSASNALNIKYNGQIYHMAD